MDNNFIIGEPTMVEPSITESISRMNKHLSEHHAATEAAQMKSEFKDLILGLDAITCPKTVYILQWAYARITELEDKVG